MAYSGDPREVTNFELKTSYWYVTHQRLLYRIGVGLLIALCIGVYGLLFYKLGIFLLRDQPSWQASLNQLGKPAINYAYFHQKDAPQPIQIESFNAVSSGTDGSYDFIVKLHNPNTDFVAKSVTIDLTSSGSIAAEKKTFVYPGEEKYITFFAQKVANGDGAINISAVSWWRNPTFAAFAQPRLQFDVTDIKFENLSDPRVQTPVSTLSFTIANNSAFSYWQVGVHMTVLSAGRPIGANYTILDQFKSGEKRTVQMRWNQALEGANETQILPEVDILNDAVYMSN